MSVTMQRESTEFLYIGIGGTAPDSAEVAFLAAGARPLVGDWHGASLVLNSSNPLWNDAVASEADGDYYVAILIGSFGGTGIVLAQNPYQVWVRLTGSVERPVRICPTVLEIA